MSSNHFPETCNPDEYDLTVIFSELIFLADSSISFHQDDNINRKKSVQKTSDINQFMVNDRNHYHLQPQENNEFSRRSDSIRRYVNPNQVSNKSYYRIFLLAMNILIIHITLKQLMALKGRG